MNAEKIEKDFDTKAGFAWVTFTSKGEEFILQACLMEPKKCIEDEEYRRKLWSDKNAPKYIKQIKENDDGMDDGICADANEKAFKEFGREESIQFFYKEIKKIGIRVI